MADRWQDPFVVWAWQDAHRAQLRADRMREIALHTMQQSRELRSERPTIGPAAEAKLRAFFDR